MNIVIISLIMFAIVSSVSGVLFLFKFLANLQTQFSAFHQIQELYHKDLTDKLKLLRFVEILRIRDYCIQNEMYESAREFTDLLNKEFSDILPKKPHRENGRKG